MWVLHGVGVTYFLRVILPNVGRSVVKISVPNSECRSRILPRSNTNGPGNNENESVDTS